MSDLTLIPSRFVNLTPSDTAAVGTTIGLYVGGDGVVRASGRDGVVADFTVTTGQYLSGQFTLVLATGTTATGLVALFA
jgi:hypothetical protein